MSITTTDAKRRGITTGQNRLIVDGRYMICPRCRREQDILRYIPMGQIEEFRSETVPIYKCPECRWHFAPALTDSEFALAARLAEEEASA